MAYVPPAHRDAHLLLLFAELGLLDTQSLRITAKNGGWRASCHYPDSLFFLSFLVCNDRQVLSCPVHSLLRFFHLVRRLCCILSVPPPGSIVTRTRKLGFLSSFSPGLYVP